MPFDICAHDLSKIFWQRLLRLSAWKVDDVVADALNTADITELDREDMEYKTGSIPLATATWLTLLADHIRPKHAYEVGTFIGRSTRAIAAGMNGGILCSCDASNPAPESIEDEVFENQTIISLHPKTTSTDMFSRMDTAAAKGDLFFFDGRIMPDDVALIRNLSHENTVYAFDDFEGIEKGVSNVATLRTREAVLILPPDQELLAPFGVVDRSTLALLVPLTMFRFTAQ